MPSIKGYDYWGLNDIKQIRLIVRLYRDSNLQMDEMKDDSPFRHLAWRQLT